MNEDNKIIWVNISLSAEEINKYVSDQIIKSALGENLKNSIDKAIKELTSSYDNPIKPLIKAHIIEYAKAWLAKDENKEIVNNAIAKYFSAEIIDNIICYGLKVFSEKILDR